MRNRTNLKSSSQKFELTIFPGTRAKQFCFALYFSLVVKFSTPNPFSPIKLIPV